MTDAAALPGPLIGSGRAADVYAIDGGRVLRRYRIAHSCAGLALAGRSCIWTCTPATSC